MVDRNETRLELYRISYQFYFNILIITHIYIPIDLNPLFRYIYLLLVGSSCGGDGVTNSVGGEIWELDNSGKDFLY